MGVFEVIDSVRVLAQVEEVLAGVLRRGGAHGSADRGGCIIRGARADRYRGLCERLCEVAAHRGEVLRGRLLDERLFPDRRDRGGAERRRLDERTRAGVLVGVLRGAGHELPEARVGLWRRRRLTVEPRVVVWAGGGVRLGDLLPLQVLEERLVEDVPDRELRQGRGEPAVVDGHIVAPVSRLLGVRGEGAGVPEPGHGLPRHRDLTELRVEAGGSLGGDLDELVERAAVRAARRPRQGGVCRCTRAGRHGDELDGQVRPQGADLEHVADQRQGAALLEGREGHEVVERHGGVDEVEQPRLVGVLGARGPDPEPVAVVHLLLQALDMLPEGGELPDQGAGVVSDLRVVAEHRALFLEADGVGAAEELEHILPEAPGPQRDVQRGWQLVEQVGVELARPLDAPRERHALALRDGALGRQASDQPDVVVRALRPHDLALHEVDRVARCVGASRRQRASQAAEDALVQELHGLGLMLCLARAQ